MRDQKLQGLSIFPLVASPIIPMLMCASLSFCSEYLAAADRDVSTKAKATEAKKYRATPRGQTAQAEIKMPMMIITAPIPTKETMATAKKSLRRN